MVKSIRGGENRGGSALLLGLLAFLIVGLVFYFQRMHGSVHQIGKDGESNITPPWRQWHKLQTRIRVKPETIEGPGEYQNQLSEPMWLTSSVYDGEEHRGKVEMSIGTDGTVYGGWRGEFFVSKKVDFQVMGCDFKGTIDSAEIYIDEDGEEDDTQLFFLAKGYFTILESNSDGGTVRNLTGDAYLRGWISVENEIEGEMIYTSDTKNFYLYTFEGEAGDS